MSWKPQKRQRHHKSYEFVIGPTRIYREAVRAFELEGRFQGQFQQIIETNLGNYRSMAVS